MTKFSALAPLIELTREVGLHVIAVSAGFTSTSTSGLRRRIEWHIKDYGNEIELLASATIQSRNAFTAGLSRAPGG